MKKQSLTSSVSSSEHDMTADGSGNVDIDLNIVRRALCQILVVCLDQFVVRRTVAALSGTCQQECMPGSCTPSIRYSFPCPLDQLRTVSVEIESHSTAMRTLRDDP